MILNAYQSPFLEHSLHKSFRFYDAYLPDTLFIRQQREQPNLLQTHSFTTLDISCTLLFIRSDRNNVAIEVTTGSIGDGVWTYGRPWDRSTSDL